MVNSNADLLNIHSVVWRSKANGPGTRIVIWFQGCDLHCEGCFNPGTHSFESNHLITPEQLTQQIIQNSAWIDGVTISGGEPFQQPGGLLKLVRLIRAKINLSVVLFTGFTISEISKIEKGKEILKFLDVLKSGRYINGLHVSHGLITSSNQSLYFLSDRIKKDELTDLPDFEIMINNSGNVVVSGNFDFKVLYVN
jgi:anaerobic ribonucleoside-triphosphate reductase activating protein